VHSTTVHGTVHAHNTTNNTIFPQQKVSNTTVHLNANKRKREGGIIHTITLVHRKKKRAFKYCSRPAHTQPQHDKLPLLHNKAKIFTTDVSNTHANFRHNKQDHFERCTLISKVNKEKGGGDHAQNYHR